jgi:dihydrofolate reductase
MSKIDYYVGQSLDGYIATHDNDLSWLVSTEFGPDGYERGYKEFISGIGAIAMGSTTYEWLLREMPEWTYKGLPAWVFTRREGLAVPDEADVRFTSAPVTQVAAAMRAAAGDKDVWLMGGGDLAGQFAAAGVLDRLSVCIVPSWLGGGRPTITGPLSAKLTFLRADVYPTGPVLLRYAVES